jgi:hypothetical protein
MTIKVAVPWVTLVPVALAGACSSGQGQPQDDLLAEDAAAADDASSASDAQGTPRDSASGAHDGGSGAERRVASQVVFDNGLPACGSTACDLANGKECCVTGTFNTSSGTFSADYACQAPSASCNPQLGGALRCVEAADCPSGEVCCGHVSAATTTSTCESSCEASADAGGGTAPLCQTNAECPNHDCTWQDCKFNNSPLTQAELTMCGVQTGAPFYCHAH